MHSSNLDDHEYGADWPYLGAVSLYGSFVEGINIALAKRKFKHIAVQEP